MDLNRYLELKKTAQTETTSRSICLNCLRPKTVCFCEMIKPFETNIAIKILMHPKEARREQLGTGRLTHLALKNSEIIVGATFDNNDRVQELLNSADYFPMILYPGPNSINLSQDYISEDFFQKRTPIIFVIDGTWPCAKSMMRDSKTLHSLPRLSFDPKIESKFAIKHQPQKFCLSTIESIYNLISLLEKSGVESCSDAKEILPAILQKLVDVQIECANAAKGRGDSRGGRSYKTPSERVPSKKWQNRKVCFEG